MATNPQLILQLPATGNVSGLLDAILTARFPDPVERAQQVQDLIERQALPSELPGGVNIYSKNANVYTSGSGTFALIGARNTLALNLYYLKTETLPDAAIPPTFITLNNNVQTGAQLSLSHRLTPVVSVNATAGWSETRGFDQSAGLVTDQNLLPSSGQSPAVAAHKRFYRRPVSATGLNVQRYRRPQRSCNLRWIVSPAVGPTMYEDFYRLTGKPFQLSPDPAFYFGSKGHSSAFAYLKYGVYQGEGFLVITGDIGTGKTTLVRALLDELDTGEVVAAQIVSTQLDADDLLRSVAAAFGINVGPDGKARLLATIEAFLVDDFSEGKACSVDRR